jgi:hypothetical protein
MKKTMWKILKNNKRIKNEKIKLSLGTCLRSIVFRGYTEAASDILVFVVLVAVLVVAASE